MSTLRLRESLPQDWTLLLKFMAGFNQEEGIALPLNGPVRAVAPQLGPYSDREGSLA